MGEAERLRIAKGLAWLEGTVRWWGQHVEEGEMVRVPLDLGSADGVEALLADYHALARLRDGSA